MQPWARYRVSLRMFGDEVKANSLFEEFIDSIEARVGANADPNLRRETFNVAAYVDGVYVAAVCDVVVYNAGVYDAGGYFPVGSFASLSIFTLPSLES